MYFNIPIKSPIFAAAFSCLTASLPAATVMTVGDLSIVGYSSDGVDQIAFVTWKDLDAATTINFTDRGWRTTANTFTKNPSDNPATPGLSPTDGTVSWTSGAAIPAGTIIYGTASGTAYTWNLGSSSGNFGSTGLSGTGESIFAYTGTAASPNLLFGLYYYPTTWSATDPGEYSTSVSQLPGVLTVALGNVWVGGGTENDNGFFSGSLSNQTSLQNYRALITNSANWTVSDTESGDNLASNFSSTRFTTAPEASTLLLSLAGLLATTRRRR